MFLLIRTDDGPCSEDFRLATLLSRFPVSRYRRLITSQPGFTALELRSRLRPEVVVQCLRIAMDRGLTRFPDISTVGEPWAAPILQKARSYWGLVRVCLAADLECSWLSAVPLTFLRLASGPADRRQRWGRLCFDGTEALAYAGSECAFHQPPLAHAIPLREWLLRASRVFVIANASRHELIRTRLQQSASPAKLYFATEKDVEHALSFGAFYCTMS